jgi:hypothetical protein
MKSKTSSAQSLRRSHLSVIANHDEGQRRKVQGRRDREKQFDAKQYPRLFAVDFLFLFLQLILRFRVIFIGNTTIDRAYFSALSLIKKADALGAKIGVDHKDVLALSDRLIRAFRFAHATVDALLSDFQRHSIPTFLEVTAWEGHSPSLPCRQPAYGHIFYRDYAIFTKFQVRQLFFQNVSE